MQKPNHPTPRPQVSEYGRRVGAYQDPTYLKPHRATLFLLSTLPPKNRLPYTISHPRSGLRFPSTVDLLLVTSFARYAVRGAPKTHIRVPHYHCDRRHFRVSELILSPLEVIPPQDLC